MFVKYQADWDRRRDRRTRRTIYFLCFQFSLYFTVFCIACRLGSVSVWHWLLDAIHYVYV